MGIRVSMKFFIVFFLISCSSISQNLIKKGNAPLSHGQAAEKHWDSEMPLKRVSWYTELTMIFDLFYVDAKNINEFENWYSDFEKRTLDKCEQSYLTFVYELDDRRYSKLAFFQDMREQGFEVLEVPNFKSHLILHPDYEELSFGLYEVKLLCSKTKGQELRVILPSYQVVRLNP